MRRGTNWASLAPSSAGKEGKKEEDVQPLPLEVGQGGGFDLRALLTLAALVLALVGPALMGLAAFPGGDFVDQFYLFAQFAAGELAQGRLPLWNPHTFSGHPFLADIQSGVLYPPNLAMLLLAALAGGRAPLQALVVLAGLHLFLAGAFTYLFARRTLGSQWAALLAAVTFTLGGYLTSYPPLQLAVLQTNAWLPLVLWLVDRLLEEMRDWRLGIGDWRMGDWRRGTGDSRLEIGATKPQSPVSNPQSPPSTSLLLLCLAWAMVVLPGHPQSALYVGYAALAWTLYRAWRWGVTWWRGLVVVGLSVGGGVLLAAAQLLPSLQYTQLSVRASASYDKLANGFPFRDLIGLVLPGVVSLWSPLYVGLLPLLLAGCAIIWAWRQSDTPFWTGLGSVALLLSFGGNLAVYPLFYLLTPGFNLFQSQERAAFLVSFALAMLAGTGWVWAAGRRRATRVEGTPRGQKAEDSPSLVPAGGGALVGRLALYGVLPAACCVLILWALWGPTQDGGRAALWTLARQIGWAALLVALIGWWWTRRWDVRQWGALAVALVALDLFRVAAPNLIGPALPADLGYPARVLAPIQAANGPVRVENEYRLPANYAMYAGVEDTWGASPLRTQRYADFHAAVPAERRRQLLNVGYFLTWRGDVPGTTEVMRMPVTNPITGAAETTFLLRLPPGPRAWPVYQAEALDDRAALDRLADSAFDPWQVALVENLTLRPPSLGGKGEEEGKVAYTRLAPTHIAVDVTMAGDGLLALSEVWYPGWTATVDGQPAPIARAYVTLMAVPVPAGSHRVELRFDPPLVRVGLAVSGLMLIVVLAGLLLLRRKT